MTEYTKVNFLVGVNGSGKSRLLNSIGQKYLRQNKSVLAISNTVFDKFHQKGYKKLSARAGKFFLKKTIIDSILSENNRIYNILEYLGYEKELGVLISFYPDFDGDFLTYFIRSIDKYNKFKVPDAHSYIDYNLDDLEAFCIQLKEFLHPYNDYDEYFFDLGYWGHLDRNLKTMPIFRKLYELFANKKIIKIDFLLFKGNQSFKLDGASSGESHFLAQMLFLDNSLNNNEKNIILIDEPEISLHPKWQREYLVKIYDYFYLYDMKIFIATHSPLIISKIQVNQKKLYDDYIGNIEYKIFKVVNQNLTVIEEDEDYSIESLYWEVFGILTPDNSFLSRYCVDLLDQYDLGRITHDEISQKFNELKDACDLDIQRNTLNKIFDEFVRG
ncbi:MULTISPECIES: AAA family ATPase [unclassified Acinetobacter]|uniref:AAA family ATPase n=1 Tax=unclassified Acinetobacter TaxID=196816 RepID=UPI0015D0FD20|nr:MULTISPECIES: AAA family ATPase [unclassified Acinetobacter]